MIKKRDFISEVLKSHENGLFVNIDEVHEGLNTLENGSIRATIKYEPIKGVPLSKSWLPDFLRETNVDYMVKSAYVRTAANLADFKDLPFLGQALYEMSEERGIESRVVDTFFGKISSAYVYKNIEIHDSLDARGLVKEILDFEKESNGVWNDLCLAQKNAMEVYPHRKGG